MKPEKMAAYMRKRRKTKKGRDEQKATRALFRAKKAIGSNIRRIKTILRKWIKSHAN